MSDDREPAPAVTATCTNADCAEVDVAKSGTVPAGVAVVCGTCGELCEVAAS